MNRDIIVLREVVVKLTQLLAGQSLEVTQRGTRAYVATNPKTLKPVRVNIPFIPDNASESLILAIQGFIDHEVGHILETDWKVCLKATKLGERTRGSWNMFEDTFIERQMAARFKGTGYNLAKLHRFFIDHITTPAFKVAEAKGDAATMFAVMMVPIARAWSGQSIFQDHLDAIDIWNHPLLKAKIDRIRPIQAKVPKIRNSQDSFDLAIELNELLKAPKQPPKPKPPEPEPEPEKDEANGGKGDEPEDEGEGAPDEKLHEAPQEKPNQPDDEPADGDEPEDDGPIQKGKDGKDPLTDQERRILTARFDRGKSFDDIARKAKMTTDAVEQVYDRAMTKLRNGFGEAA